MNTTAADSKPGLAVELNFGVQSSVRPFTKGTHAIFPCYYNSLQPRAVKIVNCLNRS